MCELNAYVYEEGAEKLFLDNVETIRLEGQKVLLRNLFGEEKVFDGVLEELSLSRHKILLRKR